MEQPRHLLKRAASVCLQCLYISTRRGRSWPKTVRKHTKKDPESTKSDGKLEGRG
nr:MAG TPA: hypothetical protein [Caudoviricetes sp.]